LLRRVRHAIEACGAVDDNGNSCPPAELQPWSLGNGAAEGRDRHNQSNPFEEGVTRQPIRIEHPGLQVHVREVNAVATVFGGHRRGDECKCRDKRERAHLIRPAG
jgi:hypothetical protein